MNVDDKEIIGLIIDKFHTLPKKRKDELLRRFFWSNDVKFNEVIKFMNYEKPVLENKNITEGDWIYVPLDISAWPKPSKEYYESNNLVNDKKEIRVQVTKIGFLDDYSTLKFYTTLTIESEVKVYNGNLPKQIDLLDL